MNLPRLLRTVRYLKPVQLINRVTRRIAPARLTAGPPLSLRARHGAWMHGGGRAASMTGPDRYRFLNHDGGVARAEDWNDPAQPKLWLYNLHYFDDLNSDGADDRAVWHQAAIVRWISENPIGAGNGWEPYPLSLRIVNWIKYDLARGALTLTARESLANQARALEGRIEYHLLGNHLFANAKALIFAGAYFDGAEAERFLALGLRLLIQEMGEQILSDGGHFERSPMYHAIILEDVLDLLALSQVFPGALGGVREKLSAAAGPMLSWLAAMTHPDGGLSFFNDAAFGIAPAQADLFRFAAGLGLPKPSTPADGLHLLDPSGYVRLQNDRAVAILDAAPIGPDYLPGHAHADTLSFEASFGGRRVIVNGGTSVYGLGPQREAERSTASHSTLQIEGGDSSEVWAGFRAGRRARVFDRVPRRADDEVAFAASHDGYRALKGRPVHRRAWSLTERTLSITDAVIGPPATAVARFHLHPDVSASLDMDKRGGALTIGRQTIRWTTTGEAAIAASEWRPEFGKRMAAQQIVITMTAASLTTDFTW